MQYENKISLGHIVTIGTLIVGMVLAWGNVSATGRRNSDDIVALKMTQAGLEARLRPVETSLKVIEMRLGSIDQIQSEMRDDIKKIRGEK